MISVRCSCGVCDVWALVELQVRVTQARFSRAPLLTRFCGTQGEVGRDGEVALDDVEVGVLCCTSAVREPLLLSHPAHAGC